MSLYVIFQKLASDEDKSIYTIFAGVRVEFSAQAYSLLSVTFVIKQNMQFIFDIIGRNLYTGVV